MSLEGGKVFCFGKDDNIEKILEPNEKIFTIGYYMSCDVIHEHPEVKGIHCEIACDSFGRITVKNYCETRPIIVNGEAVTGTRPLLTGSTIEVVGKHFRWEYEPPQREQYATQTTPDAKANKVQLAPSSEPSASVYRTIQKRLTVHSFAYGLNTNREEDTGNSNKCSIIQPLQMNTNREFVEDDQSSDNLRDLSLINNENCTPKRRLSTCSQSDLVLTSYSPRTGINTPKGFGCVTPGKTTPKSLFGTPRSALSEHNQGTGSRGCTTPKGGTSKLTATSMYLIDLVTPLKSSRTPNKRTPLLKSALKNSVKGSAKDDLNNTKFQGRKIALETPVKKTSVSATPKKPQQNKQLCVEEESNVVLLDSIIEQSTINSSINTDSVSVAEDSSVIEISSDGTPIRLKEKKQLKTPHLVARKAIMTSARKAQNTEKDFVKKIKNNIEQISENLSTISNIGNIRNRRSSLPAVSTLVGRKSLLSQSTTDKYSKPSTTPQRILTTSTPFRSRKSMSKMVQSTPLKTPHKAKLLESFRRHSCISSNQTTPKVDVKTPQRSIIKSQETKTPKNGNRSVLFIDKFDKSVNQIKENEEDTLNATFTVDEEEECNDGNKNVSKTNQPDIELQPLEKIVDFSISDDMKDEKKHIQSDIPEQTNISKTSITSDNTKRLNKVSGNEEIQSSKVSTKPLLACSTTESPKKVQTPNVITRSSRKQMVPHIPLEVLTDLEGLKDILKTPRTLNRTPIKEAFKTPKVEESENMVGSAIKRLMKTPVNTPKAVVAKQLFITPKVTSEENVDKKEILKISNIAKGSEDSVVDVEHIETLEVGSFIKSSADSEMGDISSSQKYELELDRSAKTIKTTTEAQSSAVLEGEPSTKLVHDRYLDYSGTSASEAKPIESKCNIKTPKQKSVDMEVCPELETEIQNHSTFELETPEKLNTLEISVNAEIQSTLPSTGHVQTPKKIIALKDNAEVPKNADIPSTSIKQDHKKFQNSAGIEMHISEIAEKLDFPNTPITTQEPIQGKLQISNSFDLDEVLKNMQTPEIRTDLQDSEAVQSSKISERSHIPSMLTPIEKILLRSSFAKTKTPTNSSASKILDYEEAENVDISVEQETSKGKTPTNQQTSDPLMVLEDNTKTQRSAAPEHSGILSVSLVASKPTLCKIRRTSNFKTKTTTSPSHLETSALEKNAEAKIIEITENLDNSSTLDGQVQTNFQTSTASEAETSINLQKLETSTVLEDDAEIQRAQNPEGTDIPNTSIQVHSEFQRSFISKAESQMNLQSLEVSHTLKNDAETQSSDITEYPGSKLYTQLLNTPKRHSFMVVEQKISASKMEGRRYTIGPSKNKNRSKPANDDNLLKTDFEAISKNLNIIGKSDFIGKKIPLNDNLKYNMEDKDKSFNSLNEHIKSSDLSIKEKNPKTESGQLLRSATFIIDSLKRPSIYNSSSQKELTDSEYGNTLTENVKSSKLLLKTSKEVSQTPDQKEPQKLLKTHQTSKPMGVKELFNSPKPSEDINLVGIKELMKTPKVKRDSENNYHGLSELLKTPKKLLIYDEGDETGELSDSETLLIEDESYPPSPISSQIEHNKNLQVKHERKYKSYPTTPVFELKSNSPKPRQTISLFTETEKDVCSTGSMKILMGEFDQDQMKDSEFSNTIMQSCSATPIVGLKNNLNERRKSVVFHVETKEDICPLENLQISIGEYLQDQMEECESSNIITDVAKTPNYRNTTPKSRKDGKILGVKELLTEPKDLEKTTVSIVKELLNTPKDEPEDIRELGLKGMLKTPAETPKPVRIKEMFCTPKPEKEENLVGVKELMHEPKNLDQTIVMLGVKELLNTPVNETNEIKQLGLKRLMKTPAQTPKPVRIKELFHSPKQEKEENLVGVKELMRTPKKLDQTTILLGVKELVKTPKKVKSPILLGIKEMFNSLKTVKEAHLGGIKELMKTPESVRSADVNLTGIKELLKTPKSDTNIEDFLGVPEMFSTPHHSRRINKKSEDEDLMKTQMVESHNQEINQTSLSPKTLSPRKQMSDLAFKTPSAKMIMVLGTPQSVNINTEKLVASISPPALYDLKENMEDIEEVFPTAVIAEESETLSAEESFDKFVGKPFVKKTYGRSRMSQNDSSFNPQFNEENEELSKTDVENSRFVLTSEEIDENSRDVSDNAAAFSMSGIKSLEREDESEEMEILQNSQQEDLKNKAKIETDLIPSPGTSPSKKTEGKNTGNEVEYKIDDLTTEKKGLSEIDSDVVQNESITYINENLIVEEKEEETVKISNVVDFEDDFAAMTSTRLRRGRSKNVQLLQKEKLEDVPKQTKIKRGRKKGDIIKEKLEITPSEDLMQATGSTKTASLEEFKKDVEVSVDGNDIEKDQLNSKTSENISEVKATRRENRKRKVPNNDIAKEEAIHENQPKRVTQNKRNLKTQITDNPIDENQSHSVVEVARKGKRAKLVKFVKAKVIENVFEKVIGEEEFNGEDPIELENEEKIKIPQLGKEKEHLSSIELLTDQNEDQQDDDKKENISSHLSSSDESKKHFSLPIQIKTRGRRNVVERSPNTKSSTLQKRKSDSEPEEADVPLKRIIRKRGVITKEDKSQQLNLEVKATSTEETVVVHLENFDKTIEITSLPDETKGDKMENLSEDIENLNVKIETTTSRRGRAKRKVDNDLNNTQQGSSSTESEAPPVRKGRPRRKVDTVEPAEQIPERKTENTSLRRGLRRRGENLEVKPQDLIDEPKAELTSPQTGRARRKVDNVVDEPKAESSKTSNLLNISTDELTPIKPVIIAKNHSEDKENVSTPKTQPKNANVLEFKTPMSTAPRARRVLRSNSTSVQISTPVLHENNQQDITVSHDSIDKIENSLLDSTSTKKSGRRRLNSTKDEVKASTDDVEKLETSFSGPPAAKSGRARVRPRMNSTTDDVHILSEPETSGNAPTSGRTRGRKRINSTKDEVKIADINVEQPETFGKTRGRKRANIVKEEVNALDVEAEQPKVSDIVPITATNTRTRGKKKINSAKDEEPVDQSDTSENVLQSAASDRRRGRERINALKEEQLKDLKEQTELTEKNPSIAVSGRIRGRPRINFTKEEVQVVDEEKEHLEISEKISSTAVTSGRTRARRNATNAKEEVKIDANEEQPQENVMSTRTRSTRRKNAL